MKTLTIEAKDQFNAIKILAYLKVVSKQNLRKICVVEFLCKKHDVKFSEITFDCKNMQNDNKIIMNYSGDNDWGFYRVAIASVHGIQVGGNLFTYVKSINIFLED